MSWVKWICAYLFDCVYARTTWPHRDPRGFAYVGVLVAIAPPNGLTRRGHIGDTLSCFLVLLEHHPVRSGSLGFLRLRFGFPLSRR